jgi:hypothetical protein
MRAHARVPVIIIALAIGWVHLALPAPVLAQDAEATAAALALTATAQETADATATPTADDRVISVVVTNDATSTPLNPGMVLVLVLVLLLVALFALSEIFRYLRDGREDYYKTFREFARRGVYLAPVMVNATATQSQIRTGDNVPETMQSEQVFEMTGPGSLVVGDKAVYSARLGTSPATGTVWELTDVDGAAIPTQAATLEAAADGASATLTAAKAGVYVVSASPGSNPSLRVRTAVTVVEPPAAEGDMPSLPFIGEGYGSVVGAILLLAVVVVLAATRAIDADIIGVLLGSIAGYLFGVGVSKST